eukprot:6192594-Pleurochrysis_carterae.AAC.1
MKARLNSAQESPAKMQLNSKNRHQGPNAAKCSDQRFCKRKPAQEPSENDPRGMERGAWRAARGERRAAPADGLAQQDNDLGGRQQLRRTLGRLGVVE